MKLRIFELIVYGLLLSSFYRSCLILLKEPRVLVKKMTVEIVIVVVTKVIGYNYDCSLWPLPLTIGMVFIFPRYHI